MCLLHLFKFVSQNKNFEDLTAKKKSAQTNFDHFSPLSIELWTQPRIFLGCEMLSWKRFQNSEYYTCQKTLTVIAVWKCVIVPLTICSCRTKCCFHLFTAEGVFFPLWRPTTNRRAIIDVCLKDTQRMVGDSPEVFWCCLSVRQFCEIVRRLFAARRELFSPGFLASH